MAVGCSDFFVYWPACQLSMAYLLTSFVRRPSSSVRPSHFSVVAIRGRRLALGRPCSRASAWPTVPRPLLFGCISASRPWLWLGCLSAYSRCSVVAFGHILVNAQPWLGRLLASRSFSQLWLGRISASRPWLDHLVAVAQL